MRNDHKLALKKVKQQILAFCLRHNYRYDGNSHWNLLYIACTRAMHKLTLFYTGSPSPFLPKQDAKMK